LGFSSKVVAFDPRPEAALYLRDFFRTSLVSVEEVALSDFDGEIALRIPAGGPKLATIEERNTLQSAPPATSVTVKARRLDSYKFTSVGFIKIDVEGHEAAVLRGATATIEADRPRVMVEIEERHNPGSIQSVSRWFADRDYNGFFLLEDKIVPISRFSPVEHQNPASLPGHNKPDRTYINNFIFLPSNETDLT